MAQSSSSIRCKHPRVRFGGQGDRDGGRLLMESLGVKFEAKRNGAQIVIKDYGVAVDFWPGTGSWKVRGRPSKEKGLLKLKNYLANMRSFALSGLEEKSEPLSLEEYARQVKKSRENSPELKLGDESEVSRMLTSLLKLKF